MKSLTIIRFILHTIQLLIGITLGLALMVGGSLAAGYYVFTKLSVVPERPIFTEEKPKTRVLPSPPTATTNPAPNSPSPVPPVSPSPAAEAGLYKGVINWSEGLLLRDSPGNNSNRIGGVGYNQQVIVLEETEDKNWQRIRVVATGGVGWVKAGNMDRVP